jgi:gliding motility-associated-like protein
MLTEGFYYLLVDNESSNAVTQTVRISKASVSLDNTGNCLNAIPITNIIPANSTKEEFVLDEEGNLIAGFDFIAVNNSVGGINMSYYKHPLWNVRRNAQNKEYLDRNYAVKFDNAPATPVTVKLFFHDYELGSIINEPNDCIGDVSVIGDLRLNLAAQNCSGIMNGTYTEILQNGNGDYDYFDHYVKLSTTNISGSSAYTAIFLTGGGGTSPPSGSISPASASICEGSSQVLTATGGTSYKWYKDNVEIPNATSVTYTSTVAGVYSVEIFNAACSAFASNTATISVTKFRGTVTPYTSGFCEGGSQLLTASGGTGWQWTLNGSPIPGANASTYTATAAGYYGVIFSNGICSGPGFNEAIVSVPVFSGTISPATATICEGGYGWLQFLNTGTYGNIQWSLNGLPIQGATSTWHQATAAGTYSVNISTNSPSCTGQVSNTATIMIYPTTSTTSVSICPSQLPYSWNGNNYTGAGTYSVTLTGVAGCDSIATLNLTINSSVTSTTNVAICTSQLPYSWNNNSYIAAGTYNVTLTSSAGCDSIATLNLTVNPSLSSTTNVSICTSQLPYSWNNNSYTTAGTYNVTLTSSAGCDSIATLNLTVNSSVTSTTTVAICTSQLPYAWNSNSYTAAGTYNVTLTSSAGCDSIATLNLTVNSSVTSTTNVSICTSQLPYSWNNNSYTTAGTYNVTLTSSAGCDSIATLNLTVNSTVTSTTNVSICSNQLPYLWNNNSYTSSGNYAVTLTGSNSCDSVATLVLTVKPTATSSTNAYVCINQLPYVWNSNSYSSAGIYNVTLTASNGCDSVATLVLTVNPLPSGTISPATATICPGSTQILTATGGSSYQWMLNGNPVNGATTATYTASVAGSYSVMINNSTCVTQASNSSSIIIVQKPLADFSFSSSCQNEAVSFTNTSQIANSGPVNWNWNFGDNPASTLFSPQHTYTQAGIYTVTLIASSATCPQLADTIKKSLTIETVALGTRYPNVRVIKNNPTQLSARNIGQQYQWQPALELDNPFVRTPTITTSTERLYTIRITSAGGCLTVDTVLVQAFDKTSVYVPTAFTPNSNNANDRLRPLLVNIVSIEYFRVYNRWGQMVYETKTPGEGWDGKLKDIPQPMEAYTWIFAGKDPDGNIIKANGKTILVR